MLRMEIYTLGLACSLGLPGLFRVSFLWGDCCRRLREEITGPFPSRSVSSAGPFPQQVRFLSRSVS